MKPPIDRDAAKLKSALRRLSRVNPYRLSELSAYIHNLTEEEEDELINSIKATIDSLPTDRLIELSDHIINLIGESSD